MPTSRKRGEGGGGLLLGRVGAGGDGRDPQHGGPRRHARLLRRPQPAHHHRLVRHPIACQCSCRPQRGFRVEMQQFRVAALFFNPHVLLLLVLGSDDFFFVGKIAAHNVTFIYYCNLVKIYETRNLNNYTFISCLLRLQMLDKTEHFG